MISAQQFLNDNDNVMAFEVGFGCPGGNEYPVIGGVTEFSFDPEEIFGNIDEDGIFTAENFSATDYNGNTICKIQFYTNEDSWVSGVIDYATSDGNIESAREWCVDELGIDPAVFDEAVS